MNRITKAFISGLLVLGMFLSIRVSMYYFGYLGGFFALVTIIILINYFTKKSG